MSLKAKLVMRLLIVALVSFGAALVVVVLDATAAIRSDLAGTEARVSYQLERAHRLGSGYRTDDLFRFSAVEIVLVMAPGTCVEFARPDRSEGARRLCSGWNVFGRIPPALFRSAIRRLVGPIEPLERDVPIVDGADYRLRTTFDPVAAVTRVWQQARIASGLAAGLAAAIALFSALAITRALKPVETVVDALRALKAGSLKGRLPAFGIGEFDLIARAIDDLAERLEASLDERRFLMKRLFEIQEEERRHLARDLHDEFGQCLTASGALAASIEGVAAPENPGIAADARALARINQRMMATLRSAFSRLRPPDLADLGLAASLDALVRDWNASLKGRTRFELALTGDVDALPDDVAVTVYRIVQEGLTNAARHAQARRVKVEIDAAPTVAEPAIEIVVTDDGVGYALDGGGRSGFGLVGMRERAAAFDGILSIERPGVGTRIVARLPLTPAADGPGG